MCPDKKKDEMFTLAEACIAIDGDARRRRRCDDSGRPAMIVGDL